MNSGPKNPLGVLHSGVDKPASGRQGIDNAGDGGRGDEDLRDEESENGVQGTRYIDCLGVALDEGHVFPAVPLDLLMCYLKHFRTELHPDNLALRPDTLLKHFEAEARATAEIENGLAGLEVQASDGVVADAIRKTLPFVVFGGVASVAVFLGLGVVGVHMGDYTLSQRRNAGRFRL